MKTLEFGEYSLPEDCVVKRVGGTIVLRPNRKIRVNEHRCRDCKHFGVGATSTAIYYPKRICLLKPKTEYKGQQIYFAARAYDKVCDKFELKKINTMDMREIIASLVRKMKVWTEQRIDEKLDERLGREDKSCYELWWGDKKNEKPTVEYAWRVYDFINDWKNGCFGEIQLYEAIEKHFK